jgi:hypothetical protein
MRLEKQDIETYTIKEHETHVKLENRLDVKLAQEYDDVIEWQQRANLGLFCGNIARSPDTMGEVMVSTCHHGASHTPFSFPNTSISPEAVAIHHCQVLHAV